MNSGVYAFHRDPQKSLEQNADEAASRIYGAGICLRGGEIGPGTNNVLANAAAKDWKKSELAALRNSTTSPYAAGFANIIALRQEYSKMASRYQSWGGEKAHRLMREIFNEAVILRHKGWAPSMTPVGFAQLTLNK